RSPYRLLWAKAIRGSNQIHRLLYHMIDVGQVALVLWERALNKNLKQTLSEWMKLNVDDAGRLNAFWSSLHDLGKASPAFQNHPNMPYKLRNKVQHELEAAGFNLFLTRPDGVTRARHEVISTWAL